VPAAEEWVDGAPFWVVEEVQRRRTAGRARLAEVDRQLRSAAGGGAAAAALEAAEDRLRALAMESLAVRLGSDRGREAVPVGAAPGWLATTD
jgi:hypothetical protein